MPGQRRPRRPVPAGARAGRWPFGNQVRLSLANRGAPPVRPRLDRVFAPG